MSDSAEMLVCLATREPAELAATVLARLVERGVVVGAPSDCTLGEPGYAPGPAISLAVNDTSFVRLAVRGLELQISDGVQLYGGGEGAELAFACTHCKRPLDEGAVADALGERMTDWAPVRCAGCGEAAPIYAYHSRDMAFGNLAFCFWNWPRLRKTFVEQMEAWCEEPLRRISMRI